jgi:tetratricopeptide (TPR) repeat protein
MKKISLMLLMFVLTSSSLLFAQDGKKSFKAAEKSIKNFEKDVAGSSASLDEAMASFEKAFADREFSSEAKNYIKKAELLERVANAEYLLYTIDQTYELKKLDAPVMALDAYKKAIEMGESKKAVSGIADIEGTLNNAAAYAYNKKDYGSAFKFFRSSLEAKDILSESGVTSRLDDELIYSDQVLFTAVSGYYSEMQDEAKPYFLQLREMGKTDPVIYEALYTIESKTDPDAGVAYLAEGREKNPDDTGMLFTEINHYLQSGQLEVLIGKLEQAIAAEPDNVSVYTTLGSVYDQLSQTSRTEGASDKAEEYFGKAKTNFAKATELKPDHFDAQYSIGALYYNKAASMVDALNTLAADFSAEGMKKYDAKKVEMDELFKLSLPYFLEAEKINPEDVNTIIALKEIYARLNDVEKSNMYKAKLDEK